MKKITLTLTFLLSSGFLLARGPEMSAEEKEAYECSKRSDKCSIARAMEEMSQLEKRLRGEGDYLWYVHHKDGCSLAEVANSKLQFIKPKEFKNKRMAGLR